VSHAVREGWVGSGRGVMSGAVSSLVKAEAARRPVRQRINGLLLLDKALGVSSNHALQQVKRLYCAAKAGHGGTLDPLASGLLPVAFGEATKFLHALLEADKCYTARIVLGRSSSTGDAEGRLSQWIDPRPMRGAVEQALARLRTSTQQIPPMYSALKREGVALYRLAREGLEVDRSARNVRIHRLDMLDMVGCELAGFPMLQLGVFVHCSKGTYVRVLAEDLGAMLGCGAHLTDLRRTRIGQLTPDRMLCLQELQSLDPARRREVLLPVDHLIHHLPRVDLGAELAERFNRGQRLRLPASAVVEASGEVSQVRVYGARSHLLGTGVLDATGRLAPQRLVSSDVPQSSSA